MRKVGLSIVAISLATSLAACGGEKETLDRVGDSKAGLLYRDLSSEEKGLVDDAKMLEEAAEKAYAAEAESIPEEERTGLYWGYRGDFRTDDVAEGLNVSPQQTELFSYSTDGTTNVSQVITESETVGRFIYDEKEGSAFARPAKLPETYEKDVALMLKAIGGSLKADDPSSVGHSWVTTDRGRAELTDGYSYSPLELAHGDWKYVDFWDHGLDGFEAEMAIGKFYVRFNQDGILATYSEIPYVE